MFITAIMVVEKGLSNLPKWEIWVRNIIFSLGWLIWAFFTPIVFSIYERFSIISKSKSTFLLIHLGISLLTAVLYLIVNGFVVYLLWNLLISEVAYFEVLLGLLEKFHVDLLIYWLLIGAFSLVDWTGLRALKTENQKNNYLERIAVKTAFKIVILQIDEVSWFEAYGDYVKVHSEDKFYLMNDSMIQLEGKLDPKKFTRIHRSTIVCINDIRELQPHWNKEFYLTLKNGKKLKVSRTYQENLRSFFKTPGEI